MSILIEKLKKHSVVLFLCLAACMAYSIFLSNVATVNLSIQVEKRTLFQMYWAPVDQGFSEKRSVKLVVTPDQKTYQFLLTNLINAKRIRLDPHKYVGKSIVEKITIEQKGIKPLHFNFKQGFYPFKELNHIILFLSSKMALTVKKLGSIFSPFIFVIL
jgi:hypothetical protein